MSHDQSAYGLWALVVLNSAIFIMFAYSFFKPAKCPGLENIWGLLCFYRGPLC